MTINKLLTNSIFSFLLVLLNSISYLLIYLLIIEYLGQSQLGLWVLITAIPTAVASFGTGVSGCLLKFIPEYHVQNDIKKINSLFFSGLVFNLIISVIISVICFIGNKSLLSFILDISIVPDEYAKYFKIALVTLVFNILNSVIYAIYDGMQLTYLKNKFLIVGLLVLLFITVLSISKFGLLSIFFAQLIQSIFIFLCLLFYLIKLNFININLFTVSKNDIKLFFKIGHNFQIISLTLIFFEPITKYFLNKYTGLSIVGIFELANKILLQLRTLLVASMQVLIPYITHKKALGDLNVDEIFTKLFKISSLIAAFLFTIVLFTLIVIYEKFDFQNGTVFIQMAFLLAIAYYINTVTSVSYFIFWGLSYFNIIVFSHLILIIINISFFFILHNYLSGGFWILPMVLSLIISSLYTHIKFKIKFPNIYIGLTKNEIVFYILTIGSISLSYIGFIFQKSIQYQLINLAFVFVLQISLLLTNSFLRENILIIFSRRKN